MGASDSKSRVLVAMSGGVDSAVAAGLLAKDGWEVVGVAMRLYSYPEDMRKVARTCCAPDDLQDARRVAAKVGASFYVANAQEEFKERVIEPFVADYRAGRTPSPCVLCNDHLKFDMLFERMRAFGLDKLATGHYAQVDQASDGRWRLLRGASHDKDQSYFLFGLGQRQLSQLLFPVGHLPKSRVRELADEMGLSIASKPDSQDICFVSASGGNAAAFVENWSKTPVEGGDILDDDGKLLGRHDGVHHFTVGQRKGLMVPSPVPLFVKSIDAGSRRIVVGTKENAGCDVFRVERTNFVSGAAPSESQALTIRVRHRHVGVEGTVRVDGERSATVHLSAPTVGVAPGQAAVFYDGEEVVGGGWIC